MNAQALGIDFANAWGSIMYTSHLYNAARQEKLLPKSWKDMEMVIALQSPEKIFVGNTPTDLGACFKRFLLSMGYSASAFASNRRRNAPIASARGPRGLSELCAISSLFKRRYCHNDHAVSWTSESIKPVIEAKIEEYSDDENESWEPKSTKVKIAASGSLFQRPRKSTGSIPTTDFLQHLSMALHAETLELNIDYLRLHRFCWMLLRSVNDACKTQLRDIIGAGYLEKESQLPFVVGYILMVATQTNGVANLLLPRRNGVQVSSLLLETAAGAVREMIKSGAGEIESKCIAMRVGCEGALDFGELDELEVND